MLLATSPAYKISTDNGSSGRTRLERLLLIGICSSVLGVEALKIVVREAKSGQDIRRYLDAQNHLETIGPHEPEAERDVAWMDRTDKQNQAETQRLEAELKGYKNNLIKESIRVCFKNNQNLPDTNSDPRWAMRILASIIKQSVISLGLSRHSVV